MPALLVALVFSLAIPAIGRAQTAELATGSRVRITSPRVGLDKTVGILTEMRGDSLVIASQSGPRVIAYADIAALDVSTGKRSRIRLHSAIGLGAGVVGGALYGALTYRECERRWLFDCFLLPKHREHAAIWGGMVGGATGLVTGALIGVFQWTDRWQPVERTTGARVAVVRSGRGVGVALTRAF